MAGFFLMMAGVGTIEADNSIVGFELIIWTLITLIGIMPNAPRITPFNAGFPIKAACNGAAKSEAIMPTPSKKMNILKR